MGARKIRRELSEDWKARIGAGVIIDRLKKHINGELDLSSTQVKAAHILLSKVVPDLTRADVNHSGSVNITHEERLAEIESALYGSNFIDADYKDVTH